MRKIVGTICLVAVLVVAFWLLSLKHSKVQAMEYQEVKPYKFAEVPGFGAEIYKGVHEGCEYYVAESTYRGVSIALGRGCK